MPREPIIQVVDYQSVRDRVNQLGCQVPESIALLPRNFETATSRELFLHELEVPTVRVLFRRVGVIETPIENPGERIPLIAENALQDWIVPVIFFSYSALTQNPALVNISLGIIANYLTNLFKGLTAQRGVKLDIVIEKENGDCKRVHYEGDTEGLSTVERIVRQVNRNE